MLLQEPQISKST